MVAILQKDEPLLRGTAEKVPVADISSEKIQRILKDMREAMSGEKDAVAIAAPQIGVPLRIFVVSGKVFEGERGTDAEENAEQMPKKENADAGDAVFINPEITKLSRKKTPMEEGCLSVRWWYCLVSRAEKATIRAYDEKGVQFTRGASGLLAQIFQHEADHLNGILFIDKAKELREEPPRQAQEKE